MNTFNDFKTYIENALKKVNLFLEPEVIQLIYNTYFAGLKPNKNPKIIMLGGVPGAGKTTYRENHLRIGLANNYYVVDIDEILVLLPGYREAKKSDPETAFKTWLPTARQIANAMMDFAAQNRLNVVYDRVCGTEESYFSLKNAHGQGYSITLYGFYAEEEKVLQRVKNRALNGGQSISQEIVIDHLHRFSTLWPHYLKLADKAFLLDNNAFEYKIIFSLQNKKSEVFDYSAYKKFLSLSYRVEEATVFKFPNISAILDEITLQAYQKKKAQRGLFYLTSHPFQPNLLTIGTLKNNPQWLETAALWGEEKWGYLRGFPGLTRRKELLNQLSNNFYIIAYEKTPIGMFALVDEEAPFRNTLQFKKLTYVYIDESFRDLGLGKKIIETAKQLAKKQEGIIIFDTLHPNLDGFYKKRAKPICEGETLGYPATVFGIFQPVGSLPTFKQMKLELPDGYFIHVVKKKNDIAITVYNHQSIVGKARILIDHVNVNCITSIEMDDAHIHHKFNQQHTLGETFLKFLIKFPTMVRKPEFRFIFNTPDNFAPIVEKYHFDRGVGSNLENEILIRKQPILPEKNKTPVGVTFKRFITPNKMPSLLLFLKKNAYWQSHLTLDHLHLLVNHSQCFFAISDKNEIIGFSRVLTDHTAFASLWDVVVDERYRGNGIGTQLMLQVFSDTTLAKIENWVLFTDTAKKLCEKFGFAAEKEIPDRKLVHKLRLQDSHPAYMEKLIQIAGEGLSIHLNENQTLNFLFSDKGKRANLPSFWNEVPRIETGFQNNKEVLESEEKLHRQLNT